MTTKTVTVFCQDTGDLGATIWIEAIEVDDSETMGAIAAIAISECASAWDQDEDDNSIVCIGIAEGNVRILDWVDAEAGGIQ